MVSGIGSGSGGSAFDIARQGLERSSASMQASAQSIASLSVKPGSEVSITDVIDPMVNMNVQQHVFDASAKVISVADDMLGSLLDVTA